MSNFQWDPTQDQTYTTADGDQAVFTHTLDKCLGTAFTMNAVEQTLELQLQKPCTPIEPGGSFYWGIQDPKRKYTGGEITNIQILEGTLEIKGLGQQVLDLSNLLHTSENITHITTSGYGVLAFSDLAGLNFDSNTAGDDSEVYSRLSISGNSLLSIKNCDIVNLDTDTRLTEFGRFEISCGTLEISKESSAIFIVASQPNDTDKYSFLCETTDATPTDIGSIIFKGNSSSKIRASSVVFSSHLIEDNAKLRLEVDDYRTAGTINLSDGATELTIAPHSSDSVFDIFGMLDGKVKYPEGCFNFITRDGGNKGTLRLSADLANGFGFSILVEKKIIYIDDRPATDKELAPDYAEMPGFITVRLKN
ncbi:hypothetical protein [Serratia marcescens]|uniref:hypothetical protein n=1 Tax=Serratia marcescens TaxID=615 RepID=UPI00124A8260|nr:hypothetical protein [Serratia marcescens]KAB1581176.1 hypothetical protein F7687_08050 [Serratia marcescens]